jgi:glutathione S-transferase
MLKVYHAPRTRSVRIVWLLEELGLPYEVHKLAFDPKDLKDPAYLAVHPLGQVPAFADDDLVLNESGAITQYILNTYGKGRLEPKPGTQEAAQHLYWLHFAESTFMPQLVAYFLHTYHLPEEQRGPKAFIDYTLNRIRLMLGLIDKELEGKQFLLGDQFTAADITLGFNLLFVRALGIPYDNFPNVTAWYDRLRARPAYKIAAAKEI